MSLNSPPSRADATAVVWSRRSFLRQAALSAAGFAAAPALLAAGKPGRKLNCAQIGCGIRSRVHLSWLASVNKENLVAIVDPDQQQVAATLALLKKYDYDTSKVKVFADYRVLFDKLGKRLDAVCVATPNHHHALPSALAIHHGIGVYCEKPLTHTIAEARKLRTLAASAKAPTQMGNQGHCEDGYRRLCEFVAAGVVGPITQVHSWTDRANGGAGLRPPALPLPAGLDWEAWTGPAPTRPYHAELHPHEWHGWYDFGNGSLGNMGAHVLDGAYWALNLSHPTSFELEEVRDGTSERLPAGARIRYQFPARGPLPPVTVYWYEGFRPGPEEVPPQKNGTPADRAPAKSPKAKLNRCLPPLLQELQQQYPDEEFDSNGSLYVGEKGVLYTNTYGGKMRLVPFEKMQQLKQPPRTLPRPKNVMTDFLDACRAGSRETAASFDYAARLTEFVLLGNLAMRAGLGKQLLWDGPNMKVTNFHELNEFVDLPARKGWKL